MLVLGIDPGSRNCGYGLLEFENNKILAAGCDTIRISPALSLPERLVYINQELDSVIKKYNPDAAAVENIFNGKNVQSSFKLGHARGVILFTIAKYGIPVYEYSPREVKKSVVGNGNASKQQVRYMVKQMIPIKNLPESEDATDALGVALCFYNRERFTSMIKSR